MILRRLVAIVLEGWCKSFSRHEKTGALMTVAHIAVYVAFAGRCESKSRDVERARCASICAFR
ncbi:MAG TPA: hypothetical protein VFD27_08950, partial [Chthoniobacteraceae bacterium]|nr:hypothetical protein [Chthoniobacteraceae bacterium]